MSEKRKPGRPKKDYSDLGVHQGIYYKKEGEEISRDTLRKRQENALKNYQNQVGAYAEFVTEYLNQKNIDFGETIKAILDPKNPDPDIDRVKALKLVKDTAANGQTYMLHQVCSKSLQNINEAVQKGDVKVSQWALDRFSQLQSKTEQDNLELKKRTVEIQEAHLRLQVDKLQMAKDQLAKLDPEGAENIGALQTAISLLIDAKTS